METRKHYFEQHRTIIMYSLAGISSTLVNWMSYAACTHILTLPSSKMVITLSNCIAWFVTLAFSYVFYKNWVFESKTTTRHALFKEMASFTGPRSLTGLIEIFGVPFLASFGMQQTVFGIQGFAAKVWVTLLVTILNYIFSKRFVFKSDRSYT